jgi:glycosyltransferase involved in cell wall biosynthesis
MAYLEAFRNGLFQRRPKAAGGGWYLHVSHANLHEPARLNWLSRVGARAMFMVHDLIPISHPEYFRPEDTTAHRRRIATMARLGQLIIFNSTATRRAWDDCVHDMGLPTPPAAVVPLGVDPVYCDRSAVDRVGTPYFVVVGTIEARKNIGFLLHCWREWVRKAETRKARLVIVGRRAESNDTALGFLDRCPDLAASVVELAELADARVAELLKGAQALLAPSQIEGFGLPIAEALALGLPVIASDIEAHREAGGSAAEFLDPLDGRAWMQALDDFIDPLSPRRRAALARIAAYRSRRWDDHFHDVEKILCARR